MGQVYIPGHGYVGSAANYQQATQGYDEGRFHTGYGAEWGGTGDSAQQITPGLQFTQANDPMTGEYWLGSDGAKYDRENNYAAGEQGDTYYKRRNDALTTYKNAMGTVDGWNYNAHNNFEIDSGYDHPDWVNQASGKIKTGEKEATRIQWNLDPNTNMWEPKLMGGEGWDTNEGNRTRNLAFAAMLTAGVGGAALGAYGGATAAGAGVGETAAGLGAAELGAGGAGWSSAIGTGGYGMSVPMGTSLYGAGQSLVPLAGGLGSGLGGTATLFGGAGGAGFMDNIKQAYDYYQNFNKIKNGVNTVSNMFGGGSDGKQSGGGAGGNMNWLDQLTRIGGGLYSEHQNRDAFKSLNDMYARREQERAPYVQKLQQSYDDPNTFLKGAEYTAARDIEANRLARLGAKSGTNANDTDRTRLMEAHALAGLDKYRTGLRGSLQAHDLTAAQKAFEEGVRRDANAGSATLGGINAAGGLSGIGGMIGGAGKAIGSISDWFGGGGGWSDGWGVQDAAPIENIDFSWLDTADWI